MQADLNTNININKKLEDRVRSDTDCNMKKNHSLILQRTRTQMYKYILVIKCYNYANKSLEREILLFFSYVLASTIFKELLKAVSYKYRLIP